MIDALRKALIALALSAVSACSDGPSNPAGPTGQPDQAGSTQPVIIGIGGAPFGTGDQTIALHGQNFRPGLTVIILLAGHQPQEYSGARVRIESESLTTVLAVLTTAGQYTAQVRDTDGTLSNAFGFQVHSGSQAPPAQNPLPSPSPGPVPSPGPSPGPAHQLPFIGGIFPANPTTSATEQRLVISGSEFEAGLAVAVSLPNGGSATVGGTRIQNVSSSRFEMIVVLREAGLYGLRVINPDGRSSGVFLFGVSVPVPTVASVQPSNPLAGDGDQRLVVFGSNFQPGLAVSVALPAGGGNRTISGSRIQNVTASRFEMLIALAEPGAYTLRVNNPDGGQSNVVGFIASAGAITIATIAPFNPMAGPAEQRIVVSGANFQAGMTVTVARAGGDTITVGGGRIQNVTNSRFEMLVTLRDVGTYTLRATIADGRQSNVFSFFVR